MTASPFGDGFNVFLAGGSNAVGAEDCETMPAGRTDRLLSVKRPFSHSFPSPPPRRKQSQGGCALSAPLCEPPSDVEGSGDDHTSAAACPATSQLAWAPFYSPTTPQQDEASVESLEPQVTPALQPPKEVRGTESADGAAAADTRSGDATWASSQQGSQGSCDMGPEEESMPSWLPASPGTSPSELLRGTCATQ